MDELTQPRVGQRCSCGGIGFGTIREIRQRQVEGPDICVSTTLKIEFDARITRWKPLAEVELLDMPAQQEEEGNDDNA
jgi:hypothetical protein